MSQRLNEYLAREAGDYLDRLVELLRAPGAPDAESVLRLARGARGSAQMAGAAALAGVAERLEEAARALASGAAAWSDDLRDRALATAEDLQHLLRARGRWGAEEDARARAALARWDAPADDVVPISALFHDDDGPHVLSRRSAPAAAEDDAGEVVPVESLLLRGDDALREALALRPRLESLLADGADRAAAAALLDELFDLVRLAGTEDRPAA